MEQQFALSSTVRGECLVISTSGYINSAGGEAIASEFSNHFRNGVKRLVLDVAGSKVVNSVGMSYLIEIIEQLQDVGGKMYFANVDPAVDKMLTIMGLFQFAGKGATVDEAVSKLSTLA